MTPAEYCQNKAARSGSSFYYSFLFLPAEQRDAITALYAFCREVDDVVDECVDVGVARTKLQWWRDEIGRTFAGRPQHPVAEALRQALQRFDLPHEHFLEVIDGMEMDLDQQVYPSLRDLLLYCHRVASMVGLMAAEIFGYDDRHTLRYAHDLGTAFQLTNIIRDVREDAARGRIYLPLDELQRFGVTPEQILGLEDNESIRALIRFQAQRAREYYQRAMENLPEVDRYAQRSGLIMATIYQTLLDEMDKDGFAVMRRRVGLTPLRKLWLAWRTSRREQKHHRRLQAARPA